MGDGATASATKRNPSTVRPVLLSAIVVKGFGRGSKELGIPTANLAADDVRSAIADVAAGIYFGWAVLDGVAYKACVSVGWNPHFPGELREKTVEPHLLHTFDDDFYGARLELALCGHIRDELKFTSLDELIAAIHADIDCARTELDKPEHACARALALRRPRAASAAMLLCVPPLLWLATRPRPSGRPRCVRARCALARRGPRPCS